MVTFILDNAREQKINSFFLPLDNKAAWVGLYCYDEDTTSLYFFGDKDYLLRDMKWMEINIDTDLPDFFGLEKDFTVAKKIIIE
jgi:hypothetical protein